MKKILILSALLTLITACQMFHKNSPVDQEKNKIKAHEACVKKPAAAKPADKAAAPKAAVPLAPAAK
jgi:uncharacterized protein YxeA